MDRDLVTHTRDHGHEDDARQDDEHKAQRALGHACEVDQRVDGRAQHRVDKNGDEHDHDEKRRAASHVQRGESLGVLHRERQPVLKAVDGLVLSAVVAKHALDVLHAADEPDVGHKDHHAQDAVEDVPANAVHGIRTKDQVGKRRRNHHKDGHAHHQADDHGYRHERAQGVFLVSLLLCLLVKLRRRLLGILAGLDRRGNMLLALGGELCLLLLGGRIFCRAQLFDGGFLLLSLFG